MTILSPALNSEHEAEAVRLAGECARTLLAYYAAEAGMADRPWRGPGITLDKLEPRDLAWLNHKDALDRFERAFPQIVDWRELVPQAVLQQLEEARP